MTGDPAPGSPRSGAWAYKGKALCSWFWPALRECPRRQFSSVDKQKWQRQAEMAEDPSIGHPKDLKNFDDPKDKRKCGLYSTSEYIDNDTMLLGPRSSRSSIFEVRDPAEVSFLRPEQVENRGRTCDFGQDHVSLRLCQGFRSKQKAARQRAVRFRGEREGWPGDGPCLQPLAL